MTDLSLIKCIKCTYREQITGETYFLRQSLDKTFRSTKMFRQREISSDKLGLWSNAVEGAHQESIPVKVILDAY